MTVHCSCWCDLSDSRIEKRSASSTTETKELMLISMQAYGDNDRCRKGCRLSFQLRTADSAALEGTLFSFHGHSNVRPQLKWETVRPNVCTNASSSSSIDGINIDNRVIRRESSREGEREVPTHADEHWWLSVKVKKGSLEVEKWLFNWWNRNKVKTIGEEVPVCESEPEYWKK